jgi:hypothetical protein
MMFALTCATHMRPLLRLSLRVEILITGSTRLFLRNLVNLLMIILLALSRLLAAYVLVVLLHILIMNVLKCQELSRKGRPNHDASLTSKAFVTSTHVGGHVANPTNTTDSSAFEFALSSLCAASDEQYENILDDKIALLARKFRALHRFCKERRRSPMGCTSSTPM